MDVDAEDEKSFLQDEVCNCKDHAKCQTKNIFALRPLIFVVRVV